MHILWCLTNIKTMMIYVSSSSHCTATALTTFYFICITLIAEKYSCIYPHFIYKDNHFYLDISSIILSCSDKMSHCSARWLCASVGRAEFAATGAVSSARRVPASRGRMNVAIIPVHKLQILTGEISRNIQIFIDTFKQHSLINDWLLLIFIPFQTQTWL